jgi:hypothetical protein
VVAISAAIVLIPTAAVAAVGAFSSTSNATPGVTGTNSSAAAGASGVLGNATGTGNNARYGVLGKATGTAGIGVQGSGAKYGVFSNGPLGVATGKSLVCTSCVSAADLANGSVTSTKLAAGAVGPSALSAAAKAPQPLASGESESGAIAAADGYTATLPWFLVAQVSFVRPVPGALTFERGPTAHCTSAGAAAPGYLCVYEINVNDGTFDAVQSGKIGNVGAFVSWDEAGSGQASVIAQYTVTAP